MSVNVQSNGSSIVANAGTLNFTGNGVTTSNYSGVAVISIPIISSININQNGSNVVTGANTINFVGTGFTTSNVSGQAYVSINPNQGGNAGITIKGNGTSVVNNANQINFTGTGLTTSNISGVPTVTVNGLSVQRTGSNVVPATNILNLIGSGVSVSNVGNVATINIPGSAGMTVQGNGSPVINNASNINFVGTGVVTSNVSNVATVTINSGVTVQSDSSNVKQSANIVNFIGSGVTVSNVSNVVTVSIPGSTGFNVQGNGSPVINNTSNINFTGPGVVTSNVSNVATVRVNGLSVQRSGTNVVPSTSILNLIGDGITVSNVGNVATISISSGSSNGITVKGNGSAVVNNASQINFIGTGLTTSNVAGVPTVSANALSVQKSGSNIVPTATAVNFLGNGVSVSNVGNIATVTIPGGSGINVSGNGSPVVNSASSINFAGTGVTTSNANGVPTVTVNGGITVQRTGTDVKQAANTVNFVGNGVSVSNISNVVTVTINGSNGSGQPAGNTFEVQLNSGTGSFAASSNFYYTASNGLYVRANLNLVSSSEHYINWRPNTSAAPTWQLGVYPGGDGGAWELYGPAHKSVMTMFPSGNMLFWNGYGGEGFSGGNANAGLTIGTDIRFVNLGGNSPAAGHAGIYFADGTYQYTAAGAGTATIRVQDEGTNVVASANTLNFVGSGVTASNVGGVATITISGGGSGSGIDIQDEGSNVLASANKINFVGNGVTASNVGGVATITVPGGIKGITTQNEGVTVLANSNTINFVGPGVFASNVGNVATVTIPGGIQGVAIKDEGTTIISNATAFNFIGTGVTTTNVNGVATVNVPGGSGIPAGNVTEIQYKGSNGTFNASSNLTFTKDTGVTVTGNLDPNYIYSGSNYIIGTPAFTASYANFYQQTLWDGSAWLADGDYNAGASLLLADDREIVAYPSTFGTNWEDQPRVTLRPNQFLTSVSIENKPPTANVFGNYVAQELGPVYGNTINVFSNTYSLYNPDIKGVPNALTMTNPAYWPSWFKLPNAEEQTETESDLPVYPSYDPAWAYVTGGAPQVQGMALQIYHPRRDTMIHITGNTIIGINNVYRYTSNCINTMNPGAQGPLQGDLRLQGYGNGNVIISKNDMRNGWNPQSNANSFPGLYNYSNIWNYQTGEHNGEQNNLLIEYGNLVIQTVPNVANNTIGIRFADNTFQYTAATGTAITIKDEGTTILSNANTLNFVGSGVVASNVGNVATITISGGISGVIVQEEGSNILTSANTFNFVGPLVTASNVGNVATITVGGPAVQEEGSNVVASANIINFVGNLVTASNVGNVATITVNGPALQEEGTNVLAATNIFNFVGNLVTASNVGNVGTITVNGPAVQDEGSNVVASTSIINFVGAGVTASNVGNVATVTIPGGSGGDTIFDKGDVSGNTQIYLPYGTIQTCTMIGNTNFDITSVTSTKSVTILITQGGSGNYFATFGNSTVKWAVAYNTLSSAVGAIDMINMVNIGNVYYATLTTGYATV